ncbi:MAG: DUF4434 domain-containing protein [Candidatus Poribacteria bacterium]
MQLDGIFINPLFAIQWHNIDQHLKRIARLKIKKVIFQWTTAYGYSIYRSSLCKQGWQTENDPIKDMLCSADELNMEIWLGLDACRSVTEDHYDLVKSYAERCKFSAIELWENYRKHKSFVGIYIPLELDEPLKESSIDIIGNIASICHSINKQVVFSTRKPVLKPEGRHYEFNERDQEWVAREKAFHKKWSQSLGKAIDAGLDIVMIRDEVGTERQRPEAIEDDIAMLKKCPRIWAQTSLYTVVREQTDHDPANLHPTTIERLERQLKSASKAEARIGFSYHDLEIERGEKQSCLYYDYLKYIGISDLTENKPIKHKKLCKGIVHNILLDKANQIDDLIHEKCMLHNQIITVVDTRYPLNSLQNQWQEDADWLTGLYVGAESFRYATTGEISAKDYARSSWLALHELSNVSGIPGVVARHYRKDFEGDLGTGRKRWHCNKDGIYWIGDISRDQLSGHIFGLSAYYDLVASEEERKTIESDVEAITDMIIDNNMVAVDWDGKPCIHGNFWVSPLFALAFLKSAYHITKKDRYQEKYLELIDPHYFLGHALKDARVSANPFFQHYHQDSPLYHLVQYETNPEILHHILRCMELLYEDTKGHGNVYFMFDYAICHPESDAGRKGVAELLEFDVSHLNVAKWDKDVREYIKDQYIPSKIKRSLKYILDIEKSLPNGKGSYIPLKYRPPKEFGWNYYTGEEARRPAGKAGHHGINVQYSGVEYLLAYWMGRYHGLI